jgi:hypothetical protein
MKDHLEAAVPNDSARSAIRSLHVDALTAEAVSALREASIRSILLKGPALTRWLYDDGARRPYADCDLLVEGANVDSAERILAKLGYRRAGLDTIRGDWPRHAITFVRLAHEMIDLHRTLVGVDGSDTELWGIMSLGTEWIRLCGVEIEVPSRPARALILGLHAAKEGSRDAKIRHDLGHALERVPFEVWRDAARLSQRVDASEAFAAGLRSKPAGARIAAEMGLPSTMSVMVALRAAEGPPPMTAGFDWLVHSRGVRQKVFVLVRKLFPPPAYLRGWKLIARRGSGGLVLAYLWRPFWLGWHSVPAVRAWLRGRTDARRARLSETSATSGGSEP